MSSLKKPLLTYRRNTNLSDKLVRARCGHFDRTEQSTRKTDKKCNKPWMCQFCLKPSYSHVYKSTVTRREYRGPATYTCKTENVIYLITCKKCKKQYVGETYREFHIRMKQHLRYISYPHQYDDPTGIHYNLPGHNINVFQCRIIHKIGNTPKRYDHKRTQKEEFYIDQLKPRQPQGLNDNNARHKVRT